MVIEQIWVIYALPNKHSVCYISDPGCFLGFVIKPNSVPNLLSYCGTSLIAHSVGHTHCSHTTGLSAYNFNLRNGGYLSFGILFHEVLIVEYRFL